MFKRAALAIIPLITAGLLAFAPFLYLKLTRKSARGRLLLTVFTLGTLAEVAILVLVGRDDVRGVPDFLGGVYIVALAVAAAVMAWLESRPAHTATQPSGAYR
ncbi:hypothetical protein [Streptomyces alfalfae]